MTLELKKDPQFNGNLEKFNYKFFNMKMKYSLYKCPYPTIR